MIRSLIALAAFAALLAPAAQAAPLPTGNMSWRESGPAIAGGRVTSVAGSAHDPNLYYLGAAGGGVWKSTTCRRDVDSRFRQGERRRDRRGCDRPGERRNGLGGNGRIESAQRRQLRRRRLQNDRRRKDLDERRACATRNTFRVFSSIQAIRNTSSSARSETFSPTRRIAALTSRSTAARHGRRHSTADRSSGISISR